MATHLTFPVEQTPIRMLAEELSTPQPHPAIILLHGSGGNLDFWTGRLAPLLTAAGIALYAPHYFDRTGTVRADFATITDGIHVPRWLATVAETLRFTATRPGVDPQRLVLAGISLGAFLALSHAALESANALAPGLPRLRAVVDVSGGLVDPYAAQATPAFPPTLILHGANDPIVPATQAQALDRRLTALNVAHRTEILPDEGHWFSPTAAPRMLLALSSFLQDHLQQTPTTRAM